MVISTLSFILLALVCVSPIIGIVMLAVLYRRVVSTNMVHIVQSSKKTTPYGTQQSAGNVYYGWPSWVPRFGVAVIELPVSNFDVSLKTYEAYDKDRVPFVADVTAFFRIKDANKAAQRVSSVQELHEQLLLIVQGAVRKVLASDNIDAIMTERAKFGESFTSEVAEQLDQWGVESVKSMELMDIRDADGSKVIHNIMAKKISHIDMESRKEVAENARAAEIAEITAQREIDIQRQQAEQAVGQRTAEKDQLVGIAKEKARQEVLTEEKETTTRTMEVRQVEEVRQAEIEKAKQVVAAEQDKQTRVIIAEGELEAQKKEAEGIKVIGESKAAAEQALLLAPVEAQLKLAKEIGTNEGYQQYLAMLKAIEAYVIVGGAQAEALKSADVKVIANAGSPTQGMSNVMDLFTSGGGTQLASAIEAFAQTPLGKAALAALGVQAPAASPKLEAPAEAEPQS